MPTRKNRLHTAHSLIGLTLVSALGACAADGDTPFEGLSVPAPVDSAAMRDAAPLLDAALVTDATSPAAPSADSNPHADAAAARTPGEGEPAALPGACVRRVSDGVAEHACLHATGGPFVDVAGAITDEQAPDVSRAHTHYMLQRPDGLGSPRLFARYRALSSGAHAVFLGDGSLSQVTDAAGRPLALWPHAEAACEALPGVTVLELVRGETYTLALDAQNADVRLVIEGLASWGDAAFTAQCSAAATPDASGSTPAQDPSTCRRSGSCTSDAECCTFCHDGDHCH